MTQPHQSLRIYHLECVGDDTFSVDDSQGEVSLVDGVTLKRLLDQLSKGTNNGSEVEGEALG